jgi:transcriptional regulator with XRE-family HTH domain
VIKYDKISVVDASRMIVQRMGSLIGDLCLESDPKCAKKLGRVYLGLVRECESVEHCALEHDLQGQMKAFKRLCSKAARMYRLLANSRKTIRLLRVAAELDQKELAERVSVSPSLISLIESGAREPSLTQLKKICKVFNLPMSVLLLGTSQECESMPGQLKTDIEHLNELILKIFTQYLQTPEVVKK